MLKAMYNYKIRIKSTGKIMEIYTYEKRIISYHYAGPVFINGKNQHEVYEVIELLSVLEEVI